MATGCWFENYFVATGCWVGHYFVVTNSRLGCRFLAADSWLKWGCGVDIVGNMGFVVVFVVLSTLGEEEEGFLIASVVVSTLDDAEEEEQGFLVVIHSWDDTSGNRSRIRETAAEHDRMAGSDIVDRVHE